MMSGDECRAKAREMRDFATRAARAQEQAEWTVMGSEWDRLGAMADWQDRKEVD
jgi:hypothetical protein